MLPPPLRFEPRPFSRARISCRTSVRAASLPPQPPRPARTFFLNNRKVCVDWFSRIRPKLVHAALAARQPASVVRHAQLRLAELT
eukprot:410705-Prymnesium_polylepis.1